SEPVSLPRLCSSCCTRLRIVRTIRRTCASVRVCREKKPARACRKSQRNTPSAQIVWKCTFKRSAESNLCSKAIEAEGRLADVHDRVQAAREQRERDEWRRREELRLRTVEAANRQVEVAEARRHERATEWKRLAETIQHAWEKSRRDHAE